MFVRTVIVILLLSKVITSFSINDTCEELMVNLYLNIKSLSVIQIAVLNHQNMVLDVETVMRNVGEYLFMLKS